MIYIYWGGLASQRRTLLSPEAVISVFPSEENASEFTCHRLILLEALRILLVDVTV